MPIYDYFCEPCDKDFEVFIRRISQCDEIQNCPTCGTGPAKKRVTQGAGFILSGDGWVGKNIKIAGQMSQKNKRLNEKQNEFKRDAPGIKLAPNVAGERVESWSEASKLAAAQGKDTSGYDSRARKES